MRTRLLLSVIGLGALFTVLLAACGEDPTPTPTAVPATPTPTPEAMPHPPVTLNFQGTARTWGEILEGMNKILEANDSFIERITLLDVNPDNAMRAWADMSAEERQFSLIYGLENNVDVNEAGLHPIFADSPLPSGLKAVMSNGPLGLLRPRHVGRRPALAQGHSRQEGGHGLGAHRPGPGRDHARPGRARLG